MCLYVGLFTSELQHVLSLLALVNFLLHLPVSFTFLSPSFPLPSPLFIISSLSFPLLSLSYCLWERLNELSSLIFSVVLSASSPEPHSQKST